MYKFLTAFAIFIASYTIEAQVKIPQLSPKATISQMVGLTEVEIEYFRPSVKNRIIFGGIVPFDKIWRTGANNNTIISFSEDVVINGGTLKKGKYSIFTKPKLGNWDVYFYTTTDNWGTPEVWDEAKIALKLNVKTENLQRSIETFTININNTDYNYAVLEFSWEKTMASVKFEVPTQKSVTEGIDKTLAGPTASDYYASAQYYLQANIDYAKALIFINKAYEMNSKKPYNYLRIKSLIQAKLGDFKGAIETAKISLPAAIADKNEDYVKMTQDSLAEWSKK
jgi:Protein of unknown function (DUF2911)